MVPALYDEGEKDVIINSVREEAAALGIPDNKEGCWAYFIDKCRSNLHLVSWAG